MKTALLREVKPSPDRNTTNWGGVGGGVGGERDSPALAKLLPPLRHSRYKNPRRMTTAITFSRQNEASSRARASLY